MIQQEVPSDGVYAELDSVLGMTGIEFRDSGD